jgi:hypothetical protein
MQRGWAGRLAWARVIAQARVAFFGVAVVGNLVAEHA